MGCLGGSVSAHGSPGRPHRWSGVPCSQPVACCELAGVRPSCFKGGDAAAAEGPTNQLSQPVLLCQAPGGAQAVAPKATGWGQKPPALALLGPRAPAPSPYQDHPRRWRPARPTQAHGACSGPQPCLAAADRGEWARAGAWSSFCTQPHSREPWATAAPSAAGGRRAQEQEQGERGRSQEGGSGQSRTSSLPARGPPWSSEGRSCGPRAPEEQGG